MSDLDDLFTITCGKCGRTEPVHEWLRCRDNALMKLYNDGYFVCPHCHYGFRRKRKIPRKPWEPFVELVEVK